MVEQIAKIIYLYEMGCSRNEAIEHLGFTKEQYPEWEQSIEKEKYKKWAKSVLEFLNKSKKKNNKKEHLAKHLYEIMNPESDLMWSINDPDDRVVFAGAIFMEYTLAEHERDDYRNIAHHIVNNQYEAFFL